MKGQMGFNKKKQLWCRITSAARQERQGSQGEGWLRENKKKNRVKKRDFIKKRRGAGRAGDAKPEKQNGNREEETALQ